MSNNKIKSAALIIGLILLSPLTTLAGPTKTGFASWHNYSAEKNSYYLKNGKMITASRSYPCGTKIKVTNVKNGKSVIVTVRDWGPHSKTGRVLDLSKPAFSKIANLSSGQIKVKYRILKKGRCKIHRH